MSRKSAHKAIDLAAPVVVLVNPQLGENIGTTARAMANFGLSALRLVDPRDGWPNERARKAASGADWIIDNAEVFDRLQDALADLHHVYATTARPRGMTKRVIAPVEAGADMRARVGRGQRLGLLFGRERWGLNNDEVALADVIITAPVNPRFASLNIAQAVLLVAYEWYRQGDAADKLGMATDQLEALEAGLQMPGSRPATKAELHGLFAHLESALDAADYFKSPDMRPTIVRNLRNAISRAELTEQEVRTWRGVIRALTGIRERHERDGGERGGD
ncbi:MAG TPA: RNA methyltransferase [Thermopetrobacter sp.]|nr:RNA methyltransferase [Thermopetrobacter sp.]